jgi:CubicO group peptidase (beta-lactamase class C family)
MRRPFAILAGLIGAALLLVGPATALKAAPPAATQAAPAPAAAPAAHPLTADDVNEFLDGYMPYAVKSGDVAGAVVVVVKDGQVVTERGYGYADIKSKRLVDPKTTLFRPGSISKLFMWTAVMQLVEEGKLDLDADINRYLDFKVLPFHGKPVTMRNLMTHTPGFEDVNKNLFVGDEKHLTTLHDFVVHVPTRIYEPGTITAYSNYGAALAGYIVQRVSGEPFEDYIQHHVYDPLGMAHATFHQPLPEKFKADMATAYGPASAGPKPYELVNAEPAGSMSVTGDDMSHFMIAHLQDGRYGQAQILKPETARYMHATQFTPVPPLNGMALGFYREDFDGQPIVAHAGDTGSFHSDLHLYLNQGVGIFMSMSGGKGQAAELGEGLRSVLFREFTDRYFPAAQQALPTAPTAKHDAALIAGRYMLDLRSADSFLSIVTLLGESTVTALPDGTVEVSSYKNAAGAVKKWREVGPLLWQEVGGSSRMAARLENGKVFALRDDSMPPVEELIPVTPSLNGGVLMPLLMFCVIVLAGALVIWPISVVARRRYGQTFALTGRAATLYRGVRVAALLDLVLLGGWLVLLTALGNAALDGRVDGEIRLLQVLCVLAILGAGIGLWNLVTVWGDSGRSWWAKLSSLILAAALLAPVWFILALRLITPSLNY